ncbi:MAG: SHOCT domain-containing protein [Chloroflexi bacterium]|nr:SHOCT domain-containing protein [Chloroflexota bacterium]
MWDDNGWGWGAWFFMTLAMIAFWGAVIFLVVWFVRGGSRPAAMPPTSRGTALDIAAERYARGEISEEEFARIKHGLAS